VRQGRGARYFPTASSGCRAESGFDRSGDSGRTAAASASADRCGQIACLRHSGGVPGLGEGVLGECQRLLALAGDGQNLRATGREPTHRSGQIGDRGGLEDPATRLPAARRAAAERLFDGVRPRLVGKRIAGDPDRDPRDPEQRQVERRPIERPVDGNSRCRPGGETMLPRVPTEQSGPSGLPALRRLDLLPQIGRPLPPGLVREHPTGFIHARQHLQRGRKRLPPCQELCIERPDGRDPVRDAHLHRDVVGLAQALENGQETSFALLLVPRQTQ